ncbi:MAG: ATP-grasp domain-containing protein [Patescibacteria group bacterium]
MRIAVLRGGPSDAYETSLESGQHALENLRADHNPTDIFIDRDGLWYKGGLSIQPIRLLNQADVFVNALHGSYGEDGQAVRVLDMIGARYTGSQPTALSLTFNKNLAKNILTRAGLVVPMGVVVDTLRDPYDVTDELHRNMGGQYVVKPLFGTMSQGIEIVRAQRDLAETLVRSLLNYKKVLVEERLQGPEVKVVFIEGFRGKRDYTLLPIDNLSLTQPRMLSREDRNLASEIAITAHKALGLRHYSSTDIIFTRRGPIVLEVDPLPPLGPEYHLSNSLKAVGSSLREFLKHIVSRA